MIYLVKTLAFITLLSCTVRGMKRDAKVKTQDTEWVPKIMTKRGFDYGLLHSPDDTYSYACKACSGVIQYEIKGNVLLESEKHKTRTYEDQKEYMICKDCHDALSEVATTRKRGTCVTVDPYEKAVQNKIEKVCPQDKQLAGILDMNVFLNRNKRLKSIAQNLPEWTKMVEQITSFKKLATAITCHGSEMSWASKEPKNKMIQTLTYGLKLWDENYRYKYVMVNMDFVTLVKRDHDKKPEDMLADMRAAFPEMKATIVKEIAKGVRNYFGHGGEAEEFTQFETPEQQLRYFANC